MVVKEDVIVAKEILPIRIWCPGYKSGDETGGDIEFTGNSTVGSSGITIGRQSATPSNGLSFFKIVSRAGNGIYVRGADGRMTMSPDTATSTPSTGAILDLKSTQNALVVTRMTTAQASTLSGSGVSSGAVIFNVTTSKLQVFSGAAGTPNMGYWVDLH